jgi:hypothetical protein
MLIAIGISIGIKKCRAAKAGYIIIHNSKKKELIV